VLCSQGCQGTGQARETEGVSQAKFADGVRPLKLDVPSQDMRWTMLTLSIPFLVIWLQSLPLLLQLSVATAAGSGVCTRVLYCQLRAGVYI
jgi:hypothetical protein